MKNFGVNIINSKSENFTETWYRHASFLKLNKLLFRHAGVRNGLCNTGLLPKSTTEKSPSTVGTVRYLIQYQMFCFFIPVPLHCFKRLLFPTLKALAVVKVYARHIRLPRITNRKFAEK